MNYFAMIKNSGGTEIARTGNVNDGLVGCILNPAHLNNWQNFNTMSTAMTVTAGSTYTISMAYICNGNDVAGKLYAQVNHISLHWT